MQQWKIDCGPVQGSKVVQIKTTALGNNPEVYEHPYRSGYCLLVTSPA